jgi:hypothetical protein
MTLVSFILVFTLLVALAVATSGCFLTARKYPEHRVPLVWEASIPGTQWASLFPKDTGAAEVIPSTEHGPLPVMILDASGKEAGGVDLAAVPRHNSMQWFHPTSTSYGWAGLDSNHTWEHRTGVHGDGTYFSTSIVYLDALAKLVNRDGETVWEKPGLASASFFQVDDAFVACGGKDPALLLGLPGSADWDEYVSELVRRYESAPTHVQVFDTATGKVRAQFELPAAGLVTPLVVLGSGTTADGGVVLSTVRADLRSPISGFILNSLADGRIAKSVDLRTALPGVEVDTLYLTAAGLFVSAPGSVALMDLEGKVHWRAVPKGTGEGGYPAPPGSAKPWAQAAPGLVWASPQGPLMIRSPQSSSYPTGQGTAAGHVAITILGTGGGELLYQRSLKNILAGAPTAARAVVTAEGPRVGEDYLYVMDTGKDSVTVSRATIPTAVTLAISPSGEYVLTLHEGAGGSLSVRMYRLEGVR